MNDHLLYLFVVSLFLANYVLAFESEDIIGGNDVDYAAFPYHVTIFYGKNRCGGALISEQHVVTSASCIIDEEKKFPTYSYLIGIGTNDIKDTEQLQMAWAEKFYVYKKFIEVSPITRAIDIGVIKLNTPVTLQAGSNINKVELEWNRFKSRWAIATGSGFNSVTRAPSGFIGQLTDKIRSIDIIVLDKTTCKSFFPDKKPWHMCGSVNNPGEGLCFGDAGAPLVTPDKRLVGVYIVGPLDCDEQKSPGLYTKLYYAKTLISAALTDSCTDTNVVCSPAVPLISN